MKIEVHVLSFNERDIMPWTLAHYAAFATVIVVHDAFSTDGTRDVIKEFPSATCCDWHCLDEINDGAHRDLKNNCWKGTDADWVIVVDADELVHSPNVPMAELLETYDASALPVVKCAGFEMEADAFPAYHPGLQLTQTVTHGAPESRWYSKSALFAPRRLREIGYDAGAHHAAPVLIDGTSLPQLKEPTDPPCYLLHYKHLGPIVRVQREYVRDASRLSEENRRNGWGVTPDPAQLAVDKRAWIRANLRRVLP